MEVMSRILSPSSASPDALLFRNFSKEEGPGNPEEYDRSVGVAVLLLGFGAQVACL